jgi:CheY-like chemotaxis protein
MPNYGPIVIIDDDKDDQETLGEALKKVGVKNQLIFFDKPKDAFEYLLNCPQPFIIICDINMPAQNGIEFKAQVDNDPVLREKSIPFVFFTTNAQPEIVKKAYHDLTVQGFFQKPASFNEYMELMEHLVAYWRLCRHPNDQ